jgi:hypothetical protein
MTAENDTRPEAPERIWLGIDFVDGMIDVTDWNRCGPVEIESDVAAEYVRADLRPAAGEGEALYDAIKHGDEVHRAWLREAISKFYAGKPVPPPRSAAASEGDELRADEIRPGLAYEVEFNAEIRKMMADASAPKPPQSPSASVPAQTIQCPACDGAGSITMIEPRCCGNLTAGGECRGHCSEPEETTAPCSTCGGSAVVPAQSPSLALAEGWHDGVPPKPWCEEWFIAETTFNDRVVLKALPEEFAYDFKTADETYIKKDKIKRWMQFPDSGYIPFAADSALAEENRVLREALTADLDTANAMVSQKSEQYVAERKECEALRAENARMREALKPFSANAGDNCSRGVK